VLLILVPVAAGAVSFSVRDKATGLSDFMQDPDDELTLQFMIDPEGATLHQISLEAEWDGGPLPVLETLSFGLPAAFTPLEIDGPLDSSPNSVGSIRIELASPIGVQAEAPISILDLTFQVIGSPGQATAIGYSQARASDLAGVLPVTSISGATIAVIPEPGTAWLMGLGLAGLALRRGR
jgi:hypothetical protein